jgi:hypothetical protein
LDRLIELYPEGGYPALREAFPYRSKQSLSNKVIRLCLRRKGRKEWERYPSCPERDERIRQAYLQPRTSTLRNLATVLGVDYGWIKWRATQLGLARPILGRRWEPEEDAILAETIEWGLTRTKRHLAAQGYQRSLSAISDRKGTLGLRTPGQPPGVLSRPELARLMGVNEHTIDRWLKRGLPHYRDSPMTPTGGKQNHIYIREREFKAWMRQHPALVDLRKIHGQIWFLELCLGPPQKTE